MPDEVEDLVQHLLSGHCGPFAFDDAELWAQQRQLLLSLHAYPVV